MPKKSHLLIKNFIFCWFIYDIGLTRHFICKYILYCLVIFQLIDYDLQLKHNEIKILFEKKEYSGWITFTKPKKRLNKVYRLYYEPSLSEVLKTVFLMSHMRDLEARLRYKTAKDRAKIEKEIPFWEFLDIEYDSKNRYCKIVAHYTQLPSFPALFKRLAVSPKMKSIRDELLGKTKYSITKSKWYLREEYRTEISAKNVVYILLDIKNNLIYVGEAEDLVTRFNQGHTTIKNWTHFKYSVLPYVGTKKENSEIREAVERMLINNLASVFINTQSIQSMNISNYTLTNKKIDKM